MLATVRRCAIETEDWLRYSPLVRRLLSQCQLLAERSASLRTDQELARSARNLCAAARWAGNGPAAARITDLIRDRVGRIDARKVDWREVYWNADHTWMPKAVVLKPYLSQREKGVLFVAFEDHWVKFLRLPKLAEFAARYTLVVAPSSSPYNLVNFVLPTAFPDPVFTLISNRSDLDVLPRVSANYRIVPLMASHWVNPDLFQPLPFDQRDVDLVMVASFGKVKRHHALFTALRRMPASFRILLIGQDQEARTAETIRAEARCGVQDRFTLLSNQSYGEVLRAFCRSRASVILSRQEGSCVVVAESLFADTPAALLRGAEIGSRDFINDATGHFLDEGRLGEQLTEFVKSAPHYRARRWAEANISCWHSSHRLNDVLRVSALAGGQDWTQDIAPLCWKPEPRLARAEDQARLEPERLALRERFGFEIGPRAKANPKSEIRNPK